MTLTVDDNTPTVGPDTQPQLEKPGTIDSSTGEIKPRPPVPTLPPWLTINLGTGAAATSSTGTRLSERTVTVAQRGGLIRRVYGRDRVGGNIVRIKASGGNLVLVVVWCEGEIDAVEQVYVNGEAFTGAATHYIGTSSQTGNATVASLWGQADDLQGIAYSVLTIPPSEAGQIEAVVRGRKVYDPRTTTTAYSKNPALALADFIESFTDYSVNWASVEDAADYCDATMADSSKRYEIGLSIDRQAPVNDWIETLKLYASCYTVPEAGEVKFIVDGPASVDHTLTASDIRRGSFRLKKRGQRDVPTQVLVDYTLPGSPEWRDTTAQTADPAASIPLRVTRLRMPGFQSENHAKRKAVEVYNRANLTDLEARFEVFDIGLKILVGDIVSITHPIGLTNKQMRVIEPPEAVEPGRWRLVCEEYDPLVYSSATTTDPSYDDTDLPNPADIPTAPSITLTERQDAYETGQPYSRIDVAWTGVDWPFAANYRVKVAAGSDVVLEALVKHLGNVAHVVSTAAVRENVEYTAQLWIISTLGAQSATPATATITPLGKLLPPGDVPNLTAFEAGQFVSMNWDEVVDIDLRGYQVRRISEADYLANPAGAWASSAATVLTPRVDDTAYLAFAQPVGNYYYGVKALDFSGNESVNATWKPVTVTADQQSAVIVQELDHDAATLTNAHAYELIGDPTVYVAPSNGLTWTADHGAAPATWAGIFAGAVWAVGQAVTMSVESEPWDIGVDKQGNFLWTVTVRSYGTASPSYTTRIAREGAPSTFTDYSGQAVNTEGRYMRGKIAETSGGATDALVIEFPLDAQFFGKVVDQDGEASIPASGQPLTVTFPQAYTGNPRVWTEIIGTNPRIVAVDNVTPTSFDLYAWDPATSLAEACDVVWFSRGT